MINIASITDDNFTEVLLTFYVSILENNAKESFHFYILGDNLNRKNRNNITKLNKNYNNCQKITFLKNNFSQYYKHANSKNKRTPETENTYYRIEIPSLVPVSRLLFLDCDMICEGKLASLWETNLDGKILGAVESHLFEKRLGDLGVYHKTEKCMNAGLLLIDVKKWKLFHITSKIRNFVLQHPSLLKYQDQDALNAVLTGNWKILNPKYNVQSPLVVEGRINPDAQQRKLDLKALKFPIIIHYTSQNKPWNNIQRHPWRKEYYKYNHLMKNKLSLN